LYTSCIAEAAYFIASNGEAAIIDPLRETQPYLDLLEKEGVKLKYIFETHFHADFVSGHVDLAKKTGATIVYGPMAEAGYDLYSAKDNEEFVIGNLTMQVLHTPGHTMESSTFLLKDENGKDHAIFTGDTLFLGDVGRPDLAIKSDLTMEDLAGHLFDSLRNRIMPLADDVIVYPGHGAGSSCGKSLSKETVGTLGEQKETNYALRSDMTKEEFVKEVTEGILPPPQYFPKNAMMNKMGYENIDEVMERGVKALDVEAFKAEVANGAIILDTRKPAEFVKSFIPKSLFIGIDGQFAMWVGALITDIKQKIVFIAPEGRESEVVKRLARVGYDNAVGYLDGGVEAWKSAGEEIDTIQSITPEQFEQEYANDIHVVDVRKNGEFDNQHVEAASHLPLDYIHDHLDDLDKDSKHFVHCAGGYRSVIAISILQPYGYKNLVNVEGGFGKIKNLESVKLTSVACENS
ncbi:MAG: rhodanese-like domain-containing protein, partial [Schleiferiaceae bacterium]|nr:rhodanese-like domain-containing protein [Schleiferiaceae bacterium]